MGIDWDVCIRCPALHHQQRLEGTRCSVGGILPQVWKIHDRRRHAGHRLARVVRSTDGQDLSILYHGHIANVVCLAGFWKAGKMHDEGRWNDELTENSPFWKNKQED